MKTLTTKVRANILLAGVAGVEPTSAVLETVILPLNYTPITCQQRYYNIYSKIIPIILLTNKKNTFIQQL